MLYTCMMQSPLLPQTRSGANTYKLLQNTSPQQRYGRVSFAEIARRSVVLTECHARRHFASSHLTGKACIQYFLLCTLLLLSMLHIASKYAGLTRGCAGNLSWHASGEPAGHYPGAQSCEIITGMSPIWYIKSDMLGMQCWILRKFSIPIQDALHSLDI